MCGSLSNVRLKQYTTCPSWLALRFKHTSYGFWKSAKTLSIRGARRKTQTEGNDFESGLSVMPAAKNRRDIVKQLHGKDSWLKEVFQRDAWQRLWREEETVLKQQLEVVVDDIRQAESTRNDEVTS